MTTYHIELLWLVGSEEGVEVDMDRDGVGDAVEDALVG